MSNNESTKQRTLRIELDHHARTEPRADWKLRFTLLASLLAFGYCAWACFPGPTHERAFSPGDLASPHAAWNDQCSVCHKDFTPIRADAWHGGSPEAHRETDARCNACHKVAAHDVRLVSTDGPAREASCAACHVDHRGADASLVKIDDGRCVSCHADLTRLGEPFAKTPFAKIERFPNPQSGERTNNGHPTEFTSLKSDPGNVKFNHAVHMAAGLAHEIKPGEGKKLLFARDLSSEYRLRLDRTIHADDAAPVQLTCASCHESTEAGAISPNFKPIAFERHCAECHKLPFGAKPDEIVKHGLSGPAMLREITLRLSPNKQDAGASQRAQRLLGKNDPLEATKLSDDARVQLEAIGTRLREVTCGKCHDYQTPEGNAFTAQVQPAAIPERWFKHAKFDHAAHRATDCTVCHKTPNKPALDRDTVMIAGYSLCVQCHSPAGSHEPQSDEIAKFVGTRSDCVLCHAYHGADHARRAGSSP